jgi:hypothetical protein
VLEMTRMSGLGLPSGTPRRPQPAACSKYGRRRTEINERAREKLLSTGQEGPSLVAAPATALSAAKVWGAALATTDVTQRTVAGGVPTENDTQRKCLLERH